jgi:hypothetical protein
MKLHALEEQETTKRTQNINLIEDTRSIESIQHADMLSALPERDELETSNTSKAPATMSPYFTEHYRLWSRKTKAKHKI